MKYYKKPNNYKSWYNPVNMTYKEESLKYRQCIWTLLKQDDPFAQEIVGCSREELRKHLEKQFLPGMSWENHGEVWQIDHIKPLYLFDVKFIEEMKIANNFQNLRPLWTEENQAKGAIYTYSEPSNKKDDDWFN